MDYSTYDYKSNDSVVQLFTKTFANSEGEAEGKLIGNLVDDLITTTAHKDLYSFVAKENETIVGAIFFSTLAFEKSSARAFLMAPVAVHTDYQRKGIGQQLITYGIDELREAGTHLVLTYGDPNYYSKTGFAHLSEAIIQAPFKLSHPEGWLAQSFNEGPIRAIPGSSHCVSALAKQVYW